ncbi:hypothetical protein LUTEI9C_80309 [Luteimonas sp. 9C]|nr:hypothetical protein LUTEI9C_80309 [Luteimonas sp. 9C]
MSGMPRLPPTMLAVDGSRKSRLTEVLTSKPSLPTSMPASSSALRPAIVAASEAWTSSSHRRRAWMPAMSLSTSVLMPRRSMVGFSLALMSSLVTRFGASTWARPAMATFLKSMGWAPDLAKEPHRLPASPGGRMTGDSPKSRCRRDGAVSQRVLDHRAAQGPVAVRAPDARREAVSDRRKTIV